MEKKYTLPHNTFDNFDFSESFVSRYEIKDDSLLLTVWGCALHKFNNPEFRSIVPKNIEDDSVYLAGYSEFQFISFVSYSVKTLLYAALVPGHPFQRDKQGNIVVVFEKQIGNIQANGTSNSFDCVNIRIFGYSTVEITNVGDIHFFFDDDDFIPMDSFIRNPRKYVPPPLQGEALK